MNKREIVNQIIFDAIMSLNGERSAGDHIEASEGTRLFGPEAVLDSLALVSLIVDVESGVVDRLGATISLTDDRAMSQEVSPFSTVRTLADYILQEIGAE